MTYDEHITQEILHNTITISIALETISLELGPYGECSKGADNNDYYYIPTDRTWGVNIITCWLDNPNTLFIIYDDTRDNHYSGLITTHQELYSTLNAIVKYITQIANSKWGWSASRVEDDPQRELCRSSYRAQ